MEATNDLLELKIGAFSAVDAQFIECEAGTGNVKFRVDADGYVFTDGAYTGPADFAEMIRVSTGAESVEPGDVMVIDPTHSRSVTRSWEPRWSPGSTARSPASWDPSGITTCPTAATPGKRSLLRATS